MSESNGNGLVRLEDAQGLPELVKCQQLLERVQSLPEAKELIAAADALRLFMRKADLGYANQNTAAAIAIKARRKAGEIAAKIERKIGARTDKHGAAGRTGLQLMREEAGIAKRTLEDWQHLAASTTEAEIDDAAAVATAEKRELTTAEVMPKPPWAAKLQAIEADIQAPGSITPIILKRCLADLRRQGSPEDVVHGLPNRIRQVAEMETPAAIVDWLERYMRTFKQEEKNV